MATPTRRRQPARARTTRPPARPPYGVRIARGAYATLLPWERRALARAVAQWYRALAALHITPVRARTLRTVGLFLIGTVCVLAYANGWWGIR